LAADPSGDQPRDPEAFETGRDREQDPVRAPPRPERPVGPPSLRIAAFMVTLRKDGSYGTGKGVHDPYRKDYKSKYGSKAPGARPDELAEDLA